MFFKQSLSPNMAMGQAYIWVYVFNLVYNLRSLVNTMFTKTLPLLFLKAKFYIEEFKYDKSKKKYYKQKEIEAQNRPNDRISLYMVNESRKI